LCLLVVGAWAQGDEPMQVCTRTDLLYSSPCASLPNLVSRPKPLPSHLGGIAIVGLIVGGDGSTRNVHVIKSDGAEIGEGAVAEVKTWKFSPATYESKAVAVDVLLEISFEEGGKPSRIRVGAPPVPFAHADQVKIWYAEANGAYLREDFPTSASIARRILKAAPQCRGVRVLLGMSLLHMDDRDEGRAAIEDEIKLDPDSSVAYDALGTIYMAQRQYEDAISQFQKQIAINPKDFDAHQQIGMILKRQKRCRDAISEFDKALAIAPTHTPTLVAHGDCMIDAGDTAKGISEMEKAVNLAPNSQTWNSAAYALAERNVRLDLAEKWADTAMTIQSANMVNTSLELVSATQMRMGSSLASFWDTFAWVRFKQGDFEEARRYLEASWSLVPSPVIGTHLGQTYEKLNRATDATRIYAMVLATVDFYHTMNFQPEDVAEANEGLKRLINPSDSIPSLVKQGRVDLEAMGSATLPNPAHDSGSADFTLKIAPEGTSEARRISGSAQFDEFLDALRAMKPPTVIPQRMRVEIPRRGTVSCKAEESECRWKLFAAKEAAELTAKEQASPNALTKDSSPTP